MQLRGSVLQYRLYDVAWEIELAKVQERVRESRRLALERRRFSKAFEFADPPVGIRLEGFQAELPGGPRQVNAYAKTYDYGVLSLIFELPYEGSMEGFEALVQHLRAREPLAERFAQERDRLLSALGDALKGANTSRFQEDYSVYYIRSLSPPLTAPELLGSYDVGRLLLWEPGEPPPSELAKEELLSRRFSYSQHDLVGLSWDSALVMEPSGSMDIPDLLEFANAQLLELRVYDDMLDRELDMIYTEMGRRGSPSVWKIRRYEALAAKAMRTVAELTEITEKIDNSLKVTEDVYYARVYAAALELLRLRQWETNIKRKLEVAARAYDMLYREIATKRTELLELLIVLLIALEIVLFIALEF